MDEEKPVYNPYNLIKTITTLVLPGYASIYFVLWLIWDVPATEMVLGVLALITLFFGLMLQAGSSGYDGQIVVKKDFEGKKTFLLELNKNPNQLSTMERVTFKVTDESAPGYDDLAE